MKHKNRLHVAFRALLFCWILTLIFSCKKGSNEDSQSNGEVVIHVTAEVNNFVVGELNVHSTASLNRKFNENYPIQDTTIILNKDFLLQATLTPSSDNAIITSSTIIPKGGARAASTNIGTNIWYKLIVYTNTGEFKAERTYQHGNEAATPVLKLDGGKQYTCVAYSVNTNSKADLDQVGGSFSTSTLTNSTIQVSNDVDLLFFKKNITISGESNDYLGILFEHLFNQITTVVDATATGYTVDAITANLTTATGIATLNFLDKTIVRSGTVKNTPLTFSTAGSIGSATPMVVNAASGGPLLSISSLKIGPLTMGSVGSPIRPFSNVILVPGTKYNLNLTIVPKDEIIDDHLGQPAVRINGDIWMRHNVGVNTNDDSDILDPNLFGNYYQWGRKANFMTGTGNYPSYVNDQTPNTPLNWSNTPHMVPSAWNNNNNLGTSFAERENAPSKNADTDPCPTGYRVPTSREMTRLVSSTVITQVGSGIESATNFASATILTSKRKQSVKLTLPKQGSYQPVAIMSATDINIATGIRYNGLIGRGVDAFYWTSFFESDTEEPRYYNTQLIHFNTTGIALRSKGQRAIASTANAFPVRCIAGN